jgi:hypothetical protein
VVIGEQGIAGPAPAGEPEQVGVERIGQIARPATGIESIRCAIERRTLFADEVLPCSLVSVGARTRQGKVLEAQCRGVAGPISPARTGPRMVDARLQCRGEPGRIESPALSPALLEEPSEIRVNESWAAGFGWHSVRPGRARDAAGILATGTTVNIVTFPRDTHATLLFYVKLASNAQRSVAVGFQPWERVRNRRRQLSPISFQQITRG